MTAQQLKKQLLGATASLFEMAKDMFWNTISDNCKHMLIAESNKEYYGYYGLRKNEKANRTAL